MIDIRLAPYGALLLRLALGIMFIAHAYLKLAIFTVAGFEGFLLQLGLPAFLGWPVILAELFGGIALILGVFTRLVLLALMPILLGAIYVHAPNGWLFSAENGGWEFPAFLVVSALVQMAIGDGAYALTSDKTTGERMKSLMRAG